MTLNQVLVLMLIVFTVALIARKAKLPYALALVAAGVAIGIPHLFPTVHLIPSILYSVLLPPLLFESAINLPLQSLRRAWRPITAYAVGATVLSTIVVGLLAAWILKFPIGVGLVFGALISPTDPISVIAVFRRLKAPERLNLIVEAESLFNDVVAVVLYAVLLGVVQAHEFSAPDAVWSLVRLSVGGALVGAAIGFAASRIHFDLDDHLIEITLTTIVAFGSYRVADAIHVSGIMAVVTAGLVVGNYGMKAAMSPASRLAVSAFWEYAAFVVNSIVFLLVGIEVANVSWQRRAGAVLAAVLIVLIGRSSIYPISKLVNRHAPVIPRAWQHVLVWGGLRGALCMALALGLPAAFPRRETLVAVTFGVVVFSLLVQGATIGPLLRRLGVASDAPSTEPNVSPSGREAQ